MGPKSILWLILLVMSFGGAAASLLVGDGNLSDPELGQTFLQIRSWRLGNAMLAGGALAVGGVLVQGLFRNPLASPSLLGTTAGASFGGVCVLMLWGVLMDNGPSPALPSELFLPIGCLLGALASLTLLLSITGRRSSAMTVLLTGFILSSLFLSFVGLLVSFAQDDFELGRAVVSFTLGGIESKGIRHLSLALPLVTIATLVTLSWSRHLDALLSGEDEAQSLGVQVDEVRRWVIIWTAVLTGSAVAIGGNIAFVGLIVPHALRPYLGALHRHLLPAAFVGGSGFVVWADVLTRIMPTGGHMPLGVVTSLIGAPLFLYLLIRASRSGRMG